MTKGTGIAVGFFLVLLVLGLGMYVAYTSFQSTRAALLAEPTRTPRGGTPTALGPTPRATATVLPSPVVTATQAITSTPPATAEPPAAATPRPTAKPQPTVAASASPTVPSAASYAFRLAAPPSAEPQSGCCYILGTVRDPLGAGLEGVTVVAYNEWQRLPATTKGGVDLGRYDIPIGTEKVAWYVVVVDAEGKAISPQASLTFDPGVAPAIRVDWNRSY